MKATTPRKCRLVGIYRPRKQPPGFGVPVFAVGCHFVVQDINQHHAVRGFQFCDLAASDLKKLPKKGQELFQMVGQPALYAFQHFDGNIWIGHKEDLKSKLTPNCLLFTKTPFVLEDVADFLGDAVLQRLATALADIEMSGQSANKSEVILAAITHLYAQTRKRIEKIQKAARAKLEQIKARQMRSLTKEAELDPAVATDVEVIILQNLGQSGMTLIQIGDMLNDFGYKVNASQVRACLSELLEQEVKISEHADVFKFSKPAITVLAESEG